MGCISHTDTFIFILPNIIPFLSFSQRFILSHVCQGSRRVLLSPLFETQAMLEYMKLSVLHQRPHTYGLFQSLSNCDKATLVKARLTELSQHIRTWLSLLTRAIRLAPWIVSIDIHTNLELPSQNFYYKTTPLDGISKVIAYGWEYFLWDAANPEPNEASFHPQWHLSLIGQMKSGDIDPLLSVESYLIDILTWPEEPVNIDDGYSALGKGCADMSVDEIFSWDFVTSTCEDKEIDSNVLGKAQTKWLCELTERHVKEKILDAGFQPRRKRLKDGDESRVVTIASLFLEAQVCLYGRNQCCLTFSV
eukprot:Blabericola_migrator_1__8832@NODE_466_length_8247_cov_84_962714_g364_i0_p1_GENE_NODE_466_length_8247_cov_84_962714_g364_i0NODE_466_length_8247_cov_84_962714_g364_i0_p1_ORF_typecomplete_len306_score40_45Fboxlike/PF12937_7/0_15_NODE_466_length_8247_cov_84_962714_g364_i026543571